MTSKIHINKKYDLLTTRIIIAILMFLLNSTCESFGSRNGYYAEDYSDEAFQRQMGTLVLEDSRGYPVNGYGYAPYRPVDRIYKTPTIYFPRSELKLGSTPDFLVEKYSVGLTSKPQKSRGLPNINIDNIKWEGIIQNQNPLGTCSSFAVVESLQYLHQRLLSQAYLIVKAEQRANCLNDGLSIGIAMEHSKGSGVVGQKWWPYSDYVKTIERVNISVPTKKNWNVCVPLPDTIKQEDELVKFGFENIANIFARSRAACVNDTKCNFDKSLKIKQALTEYVAPIIISVPVKWNEEWSHSGKITTLLNSSEIIGWHAITLFAYDDDQRVFLFKNSWGSEWGLQGRGTITFDFIQRHVDEAWVGNGQAVRQ